MVRWRKLSSSELSQSSQRIYSRTDMEENSAVCPRRSSEIDERGGEAHIDNRKHQPSRPDGL